MCFWSHGQSFPGKVSKMTVVEHLPNRKVGQVLTPTPIPLPRVGSFKWGPGNFAVSNYPHSCKWVKQSLHVKRQSMGAQMWTGWICSLKHVTYILLGANHIFGSIISIWNDLVPMYFWNHGQSFSGRVYKTKVVVHLLNSWLNQFLTSQLFTWP